MSKKTVLILYIALLYYGFDNSLGFYQEYNFITERPIITYWNKSILHYINFTTSRYGRQNPIYYVNINTETKVYLDNNTTSIHFSIYEFLSNEYRPSFVVLHFKWCKFIYFDNWFGVQLRRSLPPSCPHPPGKYYLTNMSVPSHSIPKGFPFNKGRIFCNISYADGLLGSGYIDLELKPKRRFKT